MSEKENEEVANDIKRYFESIGEFMKFNTVFLKNFSSGELDNVTKEYSDYKELINELRNKIEK